MIFGIPTDRDLDAEFEIHVSFRHALDGVVRTFAMHIGTQNSQSLLESLLGKGHDAIDAAQGEQQLSAFFKRRDRSACALELANRLVRIERNDQEITT